MGGWVAESWEQALGKGEGAEEEDGVDGVAGEHVPEEGNSGNVAGEQTLPGMRVRRHERPDA